jgi:hypothetical protein
MTEGQTDEPNTKLDKYKLRKATEALCEIGDIVQRFGKSQFGTDDLSKIPGSEPHDLRELSRRFHPYPE